MMSQFPAEHVAFPRCGSCVQHGRGQAQARLRLNSSLLFVVVQRVMAGLSHSVTFGTKHGEGQQCRFSFLAALTYLIYRQAKDFPWYNQVCSCKYHFLELDTPFQV